MLQDEVPRRNRVIVATTYGISEVELHRNTFGIVHRGNLLEMGELNDIKKTFGGSIKIIFLPRSVEMVSQVETMRYVHGWDPPNLIMSTNLSLLSIRVPGTFDKSPGVNSFITDNYRSVNVVQVNEGDANTEKPL